jgi:hypothetical protein
MKGRNFVELERESQYLNAKLEQLMMSVKSDDKTRWTLGLIKQLHFARIGNPERLNGIKKNLEEGIAVDKAEVDYLKQNFKVLQKVLDEKKKIQWTFDLIQNLKANEIGNFDRLDIIKKKLEEGRPADKHEIEYLKEKHDMLQKIS